MFDAIGFYHLYSLFKNIRPLPYYSEVAQEAKRVRRPPRSRSTECFVVAGALRVFVFSASSTRGNKTAGGTTRRRVIFGAVASA